jgi:DNA-binding LacI/PurR family transcriptional regulator
VTLQTIADQVGVSRMTVSNAFSRPDQLSSAMRKTILDAAKKLGYAGPDPAARNLARGTTGAIGIVLTSSLRYAFDDDIATAFLGSIAGELAPTGLALTLLSSAGVGDVIPARDVPMDAVLVYSCDPSTTAVDWLTRRNLPMVFVDQEPAKGVTSINVDDRGGARAAAQHVVDLGHTRVGIMTAALGGTPGFVADPVADAEGSKYVARERLLGYLDVLTPAGITPVVHRQLNSDDTEGHEAALEMLAGPDRPTSVLCFSDVIASGVMRAAEELGLGIPDDLSVVGFDDSHLARRLRPQLTTVRQDIADKGRTSAAELRRVMDARREGTKARAKHIVLPTGLVVRDSTAKPSLG